MKLKKLYALALLFCLLGGLFSLAAPVSAAAPDDFAERYGPLLADGLDDLADWLSGKTAELAPELRETLENLNSDRLFSDFRDLLGDTSELDDAQLRARIEAVAEAHGITLVESQIAQLMRLCRAMEKFDGDGLRERARALREQLDALASPGGLRGLWQSVTDALKSAGDWLAETVGGWFHSIF